jgi:phosphoribosylglycinamide formyltransferase-1
MTTDPKTARQALERLTKICLALPQAECERESRHATFRFRKKVFAYFLDNHHGDGIVAACVRGDSREHARLIASAPKRFFSPAYIGPRGYLGVRLDTGRVDWKDVAARVGASYGRVARSPGAPR